MPIDKRTCSEMIGKRVLEKLNGRQDGEKHKLTNGLLDNGQWPPHRTALKTNTNHRLGLPVPLQYKSFLPVWISYQCIYGVIQHRRLDLHSDRFE